MKVLCIDERNGEMIERLMVVWRQSVEQTHTFLTAEDIEHIAEFVPAAIAEIPILLVEEVSDRTVGFAGVDGSKLEMLFLAPEVRGHGIGGKMVRFLIEHYGLSELCVNEQNLQAKGFYEHMGFQVYKREPVDEQGNPFPLLYMRRQK